MSIPTFGELLAKYMNRAGISDSELARAIGVQRQTIFRWKEGIVARPRVREDVLGCARKLRLTREERDQLLLAAGFPPEVLPIPATDAEPLADPDTILPQGLPRSVLDVEETEADEPGPATPEPWTVERTIPTAARRQVRRHWVGATLAGLLLVVAGWLFWPARSTAPIINDAAPVATPVLLAEPASSNGPAPALPLTTTQTVTTEATATVSSPNLEVWPHANESALLIVVAPFADPQEQPNQTVAERIQTALQEEIQASNLITLSVVTGPRPLQDEADAQKVLTTTQATTVIWGFYDEQGVRVHWLTHREGGGDHAFSLTSSADRWVTINDNIPKEMQVVALYTLGRVFHENQAYDKAQQAYQRGLALGPRNERLAALLNFYLGLLVSQDKNSTQSITNYDEGLRYYTTAYELHPALYNILYNRGTIWLNRALVLTDTAVMTSSLTQAIGNFTALLEEPSLSALHQQRSEFVKAYFNRGIARYYRRQPGDLVAAYDDMSAAIDLNPNYYEAWYQRAMIGIRSGRDLAWTGDLTRTLELQPTYHQVYDAFCWGYALAEEPAAALPYCTQALLPKRLSRDYSSYDALGIVYARLGRYEEAIAALKEYQLWIEVYHPQQYSQYRGLEVEEWIHKLRQQQNPFDAQTLNSLR